MSALAALPERGRAPGHPRAPRPASWLRDRPSQHLGEAETIAIIIRRQLSCFFVTDDIGAARLATQKGIQVIGTWHLLKMAHRARLLDADALWGYVQNP
jgi:predicted nucleic acid-binding protein